MRHYIVEIVTGYAVAHVHAHNMEEAEALVNKAYVEGEDIFDYVSVTQLSSAEIHAFPVPQDECTLCENEG